MKLFLRKAIMLYISAYLITMQVNAQTTLVAFVYDYMENKPIPYASIGITRQDWDHYRLRREVYALPPREN